MMTTNGAEQLVAAAAAARQQAYVPYSNFAVGAAVRTVDGRLFSGCNVENASYGLSCCAERAAVFQAVAAGARQLAAVAIIADTAEPCPPCGACRQVLYEFGPLMQVHLANLRGDRLDLSLSALLPAPFGAATWAGRESGV